MNEEIQPPPQVPKTKKFNLWFGALAGVAPGLLGLLSRKSDDLLVLFLLSASVWPLAGIILAIIPATRKIGLGLLLGAGFSLIVLLSLCGGTTMQMH